MRRWPESAGMQQAAVFALRHLLVADSQAVEALHLDLPGLLNEAVRNHHGLADLQENSSRAMRSMMAQHHDWTLYQQHQQRHNGYHQPHNSYQQRHYSRSSSQYGGPVPFSSPPPSPPYNGSAAAASAPLPHELSAHAPMPFHGSLPMEPVATMHAARGLHAMPHPCPGPNFDTFGLPQGVSQSVPTMCPSPGFLHGPTLTPIPLLLPPPPVLSLGQESQERSLGSLPPAPMLGVLTPPWLDVGLGPTPLPSANPW